MKDGKTNETEELKKELFDTYKNILSAYELDEDFDAEKIPFKPYDGHHLAVIYADKELKEMVKFYEDVIVKDLLEKPTDVFDMKNQDFTKGFLRQAIAMREKQFQSKIKYFERRLKMIEDSKPYRFKDKYHEFIIKHNKNDSGYRPLKRESMWIEATIKIGKVLITGFHLTKIWIDKNGRQVYDGDIRPKGFDEEGISVFMVGLDERSVPYYSYFPIGDMNSAYEKRKSKSKYVCPKCNMAMANKSDNEYYCDFPDCIVKNQEGHKIVYDLNDTKLQKVFRLMKFRDVWRTEQQMRNFIANMLDFMNNPEVSYHSLLQRKELEKRNKKRSKKGKKPLPDISIIQFDGHLRIYCKSLEERTRGNYELLKRETTVDGHYYRFKKRSAWTKLYAKIKKCRTDDEIRERLKRIIRMDKGTGRNLPPSEQYLWDNYYKVIYVWKRQFIRWKGYGTPKRQITVIDLGEK